MRKDADAAIARASSALEVANDLNRQRRDADNETDRLRKQIQKVSQMADQLEPVRQLSQRLQNQRQQLDQLRQARTAFGDAFNRYRSKFAEDIFSDINPDTNIAQRIESDVRAIDVLLSEFWFDSRAEQIRLRARALRGSANVGVLTVMGSGPVGDGAFSELSDDQLLNRLLGNRATIISRANELIRLEDRIPDNAEQILEDARAAVNEGNQLLDRLSDENEKQLEKDQATAFKAWEVLRAAQDCRSRIMGGPASRPLTGNITTSELARQISPRIAQLIPWKPMRESAHGPDYTATASPPAGKVTVPNVVGQSGPQATISLKGSQLNPQFALGKPAANADQAFHVYEQNPKAGSVVDVGDEVLMTLHADPEVTAGNRPSGPIRLRMPPPKEASDDEDPLPPPRKRPPEPASPKMDNHQLNGTWSIAGRFNRVATSFEWQQIDANSARVTFNIDGFEPKVLGIGGQASVTMTREGNSYVSKNGVGDLSKVLTQTITFTPTGSRSMSYLIQQSNGESASGSATKR